MRPLSSRSAGSTLLEAIVAMTLVFLALGIAYPAVVEGLDVVRLRTSLDQVKTFVLGAQQFADRHRQAVLLRIDPVSGRIVSLSEDGRLERSLSLLPTIRIYEPAQPLDVILLPGAGLPSLQVALGSGRGARDGFQVDPFRETFENWAGVG